MKYSIIVLAVWMLVSISMSQLSYTSIIRNSPKAVPSSSSKKENHSNVFVGDKTDTINSQESPTSDTIGIPPRNGSILVFRVARRDLKNILWYPFRTNGQIMLWEIAWKNAASAWMHPCVAPKTILVKSGGLATIPLPDFIKSTLAVLRMMVALMVKTRRRVIIGLSLIKSCKSWAKNSMGTAPLKTMKSSFISDWEIG